MNENCDVFETSISALIDGELEAGEQLPVIDHLLECRSCREFYRQARSLGDMVVSSRSQAADPAPEELWRRIAAESGIGRRMQPAFAARFRRISARAIGIAAAVLLGVGLFRLLPSTGAPPPPAAEEETADSDVDVVLEEDRGAMSDDRFLELTMEILKADRRYHKKMLDVMSVVTAMTEEPEGSPDEPSFSLREGVRRITVGEDDSRGTSIRTENRL